MAHSITFLICVSCLSMFVKGDILPTIYWEPRAPAVHPDYWSDVVGVKLYQSVTFLCPNTKISFIPLKTASVGIYYNLYVREVNPNDTNLDYNTVCDPKKSHHVYSCNQTHDFKIDYRGLQISEVQAFPKDPTFKVGMDYIFFSTSNGLHNSLKTASTKCTMIFRIHVCEAKQHCPVPLCPSFGREKVCVRKSKLSDAPWDIQVTNNASSSLKISWKPPLNRDNAVAHYSICYRTNTSQACRTKIVAAHANSTVLENLDASTHYFIRVRAVTCKGPGNYSEEISNKTQDQAITSAPQNVTLSNTTTSSVTISWRTPRVIVGDVIYYSLCVREEPNRSLGSDCQTTIFEPTQLSAVIHGLDAYTSYGIRVRAHNFKRPGNYSEESIIKTLEIPTTEFPPSTVTSTQIHASSTMKATAERPTAQAQQGCNGSTVDSMSLFIGVIVGAIAAFAVSALVWILKAKQRKEMLPVTTSKNVNQGYRSSVSGVNSLDKNKNQDFAMDLVASK
ncbi:receptor-type tyrosine- phosphatase F isoform X1 [Paramuricea clavata]|uniref:Receptor-type tyrosine- phosphatase F isoform X1 n=1 Tax=Paramuricea clavata TaxID=317549 RepID=A0A6S7GYE7_PARCT|nr:receptor-type tyrosine- phosphatase F isoform X1 [Paramuricea clavata]